MEGFLLKLSIMLVPGLFAITVHEVSHGWVADRCGDPTARLMGRLTLNPLRHLDPIGTLLLLVVGFGWAKPVPVNFANLRQIRHDMIWVAAAGPLSNFALALISGLLLRFLGTLPPDGGVVAGAIVVPISLMAAFSLYINVILGTFNLLPIPPLDGGRVLAGLLPPARSASLARLEPFGFLILIGLIFFTGFGRLLHSVAIDPLVGILAGNQVVVVEQVVRFLLAS